MFENMHVETNDHEVVFMSNERRIWATRIANVADTITIGDDTPVSEWVTHLTEKQWTSTPLLYDFAREIQRLHPDNNINWYSTFMMVERGDYLDHAFKMKQNAEPIDGKKSGFRDFLDRVKFGQDSFNEEEMKAIREILITHLKENGLPFNEE